MKQKIILLAVLLTGSMMIAASYDAFSDKPRNGFRGKKIAGVNLVAPPRPFGDGSLLELRRISAQWTAIVPYAFTPKGSVETLFNLPRQWWGERREGVIESIAIAKRNGFQVMMKPHVWVQGKSWAGDFAATSEDDWKRWESSYRNYIIELARLSDSLGVELFCVGTEYREAAIQRDAFWRELIRDVKSIFKGKLTYAANWDDYDKVKFWDALDFIGIDAYFPLSEAETPQIDSLMLAWQSPIAAMESFSKKYQKQILFTEYGYRSISKAAWRHWELDNRQANWFAEPNYAAQSNSYEALYRAAWEKDWFAGGFLWKWYPNEPARMGEGAIAVDWTPQKKPVEAVIKKWYQTASAP